MPRFLPIALLAGLAFSITPAPGDPNREERWVEIPPPARAEHVAVLDEPRQRLIIFGGRVGNARRNDVWALALTRGAQWTRIVPHGVPPSPRIGAAACFDSRRDRMIVFGGEDTSNTWPWIQNDVWELSLRGRPAWRRIAPKGRAPNRLYRSTLTVDPEHRRAILFGGSDANSYSNEVWQLSLDDPAWTLLSPRGSPPPPRAAHSAVYSPDLQGILVFGGAVGPHSCPSCLPSNDTWLLSMGDSAAWVDLNPRIVSPPVAVLGHTSVYDAAHHRMLVLGGVGRYGFQVVPSINTWALSIPDLAWSNLADQTVEIPLARKDFIAVTDQRRGRVVIHGGLLQGFESDAWELSLDENPVWSRLSPTRETFHGSYPAMSVFDVERDRMVFYDGDDVWAYTLRDEEGWAPVTTVGQTPRPRVRFVVAHDTRRDRLIVYGGTTPLQEGFRPLTDTWTLSLDGPPQWAQLSTLGEPPPTSFCTAAYDPVRDQLVIVASDFDPPWRRGTWTLSLGGDMTWRRLDDGGPEELQRFSASALYDPVRDQIVLFGGFAYDPGGGSAYNDAWALRFAPEPHWTQLTPQTPRRTPGVPSHRSFHSAIYDARSDRMILVGGYVPDYLSYLASDDVWALDLRTSSWSPINPANGPDPGWSYQNAAFDEDRNRIVVQQGGYLWALELGKEAPPRRRAPPADADTASTPGVTPVVSVLSLQGTRPNPIIADGFVGFSLPDGKPASLELFDLSGRRVWRQDVGELGAGPHSVRLSTARGLLPGVYLLRLSHRGDAGQQCKVIRLGK